MRRRRLADLYVRGKELTVDDGTNDPVVIWIQKLNEIERDSILRRANAAKARHVLECDNEDSEAFIAIYGNVREFLERDQMVDLVSAEELVKVRQRLEAQALEDDKGEWGKDGKLKNLIDAWTGDDETPGLAKAHAEDPKDPEALKVKGELDRYDAEIEEKVKGEARRLAREWDDATMDKLARAATRVMLDRRADETFIREWSRQQIFYSVRDPDDHHKRYFATVAEVDDLDDQIREFLDQQCTALFVNAAEGKDSPPNPDSSTSSGTPTEAAADPASGPVAATA